MSANAWTKDCGFTEKEIKYYVKDKNHCPKCQSPKISVVDDFDPETYNQMVECKACGIKFYEVFNLIHIEKVTE